MFQRGRASNTWVQPVTALDNVLGFRRVERVVVSRKIAQADSADEQNDSGKSQQPEAWAQARSIATPQTQSFARLNG